MINNYLRRMYFCSENIREKLFSLSLVHAMNHGFNERAIL